MLTGTGSWTLTINGGIYGAGDLGIDMSTIAGAGLSSSITIAATGDVYGFTSGIKTAHATSITNNAVIGGETASAIHQTVTGHTKAITITNALTGQILAGGGFGIELIGSSNPVNSAAAARTITNAGHHRGQYGCHRYRRRRRLRRCRQGDEHRHARFHKRFRHRHRLARQGRR